MGKLGGFLQITRHGFPQRDPVERARDYRAALDLLASGNGDVHFPDEHPVSSGGEGFVTAEVESGTAA